MVTVVLLIALLLLPRPCAQSSEPYQSQCAGSGALSAPLDYGTTARQMLSTAGFVEPVGCREVFNFDAASLRDPEAAEAQVLLDYVAFQCQGSHSLWGRGISRCLPGPP